MKVLFLLLPIVLCAPLDTELKSAVPARESLIDDAPNKVVLTFTSGVRADSSTIEILHRDTTFFFKLQIKPTDKPEVIEGIVPRKLLGGHYLVRWRTLGVDGKAINGMYRFMVDVPE